MPDDAPVSSDPIPGGNAPAISADPIPGGNKALDPVGGAHTPGPGSTMIPPHMNRPGELDDQDMQDIRDMAAELDSDFGPASTEDPEPTNEAVPTDEATPDDGTDFEAPDVWEESQDEVAEETPEDGTGDEAVAEVGDEGAIPVSADELEELVFAIERDGEEPREVSLAELVRNEVDRNTYLQDKQRVHNAEQAASRREQEATQKIQEYAAMEDLGLEPQEFVLTYLKTQLQHGTVSENLVNFVGQAFADTDAGYNPQLVKQRADGIRHARQQQQEQARMAQERQLTLVRNDMQLISTNYLDGQHLTDDQIDALYTEMDKMSRERGEFVAPLAAFAIHKDKILAGQKEKVRSIGKSRKAVTNRLRKKGSNVPGAGSNTVGGRATEKSLEQLAEEAAAEIKAGFG